METASTIRPYPIRPDHRNEETHGKTLGRRILYACVTLFSFSGIAAIAALMMFVIPQQNLRDAQQMYVPMLRGIQPGEYIEFGHYEQDGDMSNGTEPIEWLVLDRREETAMLVSRYALDCLPIEKDMAIVSWQNSTILQWLNETFLQGAFTPAEQTLIVRDEVAVGRNPFFAKNTGEKADAKVFLLSISEAEMCFLTSKSRICTPTPYAVLRGVQTEDDGACRWWLRTPGYDGSAMSRVSANGNMCYCGQHVWDKIAVRPAIRVTFAEEMPDV